MTLLALGIIVAGLAALAILLRVTYCLGYDKGWAERDVAMRVSYPHLRAYDTMMTSYRSGQEATRKAFQRHTTRFDKPFDWMEHEGPADSV